MLIISGIFFNFHIFCIIFGEVSVKDVTKDVIKLTISKSDVQEKYITYSVSQGKYTAILDTKKGEAIRFFISERKKDISEEELEWLFESQEDIDDLENTETSEDRESSTEILDEKEYASLLEWTKKILMIAFKKDRETNFKSRPAAYSDVLIKTY